MALANKTDSSTGPQQRVRAYLRVSTERQADSGLGLDEQEHKIRARCNENGWTLERVYTDAGVSGSIPLSKRPQGAQLLAMLRPGDVVIASRMDRMFRSAFDALGTIEGFKKRKISLWLLDLGGDVCANGISQMVAGILGAVAEFERTLISERIKAAKTALRRGGRHQGGKRPFGWTYGPVTGTGRARDLVPDEREQAALAEIVALRTAGKSLEAIRDAMRGQGFSLCKKSVWNILSRQAEGAAAY